MIRRPRKRMTLASLKRHIDRRFATKADLRQFATKADLHQFATKRDLCRFATKRDLRRFATKAELRFATKEDMAALEARMDAGFAGVARQLDSLNQKIDAVLDYAKGETRLHTTVLGEHENRLRDLEAGAIG
ncbi:MAG: hypothetical protein DMF97_13975 [Acidobacteria bacterium]|nr:MAG: hypothetical protein DMF97_13975 [Acidobacteriota bacterium]